MRLGRAGAGPGAGPGSAPPPPWTPGLQALRAGTAWEGAAGGGACWRPRAWEPRSCSFGSRPAPCAWVSARWAGGGWGAPHRRPDPSAREEHLLSAPGLRERDEWVQEGSRLPVRAPAPRRVLHRSGIYLPALRSGDARASAYAWVLGSMLGGRRGPARKAVFYPATPPSEPESPTPRGAVHKSESLTPLRPQGGPSAIRAVVRSRPDTSRDVGLRSIHLTVCLGEL